MTAIITAITGVFSAMIDWIVDAVPDVIALFYDSTTGLTFMGTLAVIALAVSVFFLLMGVVQNFLHFGG